MKFVAILAALAATALAAPTDDWNNWEAKTITVYVTKTEYKDNYKTVEKPVYETKYETKYGWSNSKTIFGIFTNYIQKQRPLRNQ